MNLKKLESYLRINLLEPGPRLIKKRIYRAAVLQTLSNTGAGDRPICRSGRYFPTCISDDHLHRVTYTRCCIDTIGSPDDEQKVARNMQRIEINTYKKNCASSWLFIGIIPRCTVTRI